MDKAVKLSIIVGISIVSLSVAYYLVVFLPQKEGAGVELQRQEQEMKKSEEIAKKAQQEKLRGVIKRVLELDDQGKLYEANNLIYDLTPEEAEIVNKVFKQTGGTWTDITP